MTEERQRIDKWLWAARFFKTRSLAAIAIDGGKVKWNGQTAKPAREIKPGDVLEIVTGDVRLVVTVQGLNLQRRPASEACLLYMETADSRNARLRDQEVRRLAPSPGADLKGRPSKKAGRLIRGFNS